MMRRWMGLVFLFVIFTGFGAVPTALATAIGVEPKAFPKVEHGARQATITNAPKDFQSGIGGQGRITAIKGNQVTIQNLKDPSRTATVTVDNASLFKVGQEVMVTGNLLKLK